MTRMLFLLPALLASTITIAAPATGDDAAVRAAIQRLAPNATIESIGRSAMPGVHEAMVDGQLLYVSADGEFLLSGALFDVSERKNLSEPRYAQRRRDVLATITPAERIVFAAEKPTHTVTIFTDIDCAFCRKLHQEVADFNAAGITVEYLLFPRGGIGSPAYTQAVAASCADDRRDAITRLMNGETIAQGAMCANPVARTFDVGRRIGISATPTIIAADGTVLGGYMTSRDVLAKLDATPR